jgi:hydroxyacylglutathione hydrolase
VRLRALAMPGHRPEHTALLVSDDARSAEPWLLLSGDSVFVGDLARPDLAVEPREGARELHASLRRLDALDGGVEVWPGHIGGSLCGGAGMSEKPSSTLAYERRANELLGLRDRASFVERVTRDLAPQPPNFRRIVELNRGPLVTQAAPLPGLGPERVAELLGDGAILLDGRAPRAWDAEHVPGSLSVTMVHAAVGTRAAWVVDPLAQVVVTAASDADARRMARMLEAVGFRRLEGYLAGGLDAWRDAGLATESTPAIDVAGLAARLRAGEVRLLDVREDDEWREGHVAGSEHLPYHELRDGPAGAVAGDGRPLAVACSAGNRAALAVSLLRRHGVDGVVHVAGGGIAELADHGIELTAPEAA